jgi:hypothetical protein
MGTNETILKKAQAGIETVRGTGVAATRKLYAQITGNYAKALQTFVDTTGSFFSARRAAYGREQVTFSAVDMATFEDIVFWASMFIKGGVTPTSDAETPPAYTWVFSPSLATDDLKSITLEHGEPSNRYKTTQVMVTQAVIRFDADSDTEPAVMLDLQLEGIGWVTAAFTAAIGDRATEPITARGMKLYLDDAGGTIGTTQVLGKLISGSVTFNPNIHFKAFSENETGPAPGKVGRGSYDVTYQFVMEFDDDVQFAKHRDPEPQDQLIRLSREGSEINDSPANNLFQLDIFRGIWSSWSPGDRDGNMIATMGGMAYVDIAEGKSFELTVVNAVASL